MRKDDFIKDLIIDNETSGDMQGIYANVIECVKRAISNAPSDIEIDGKLGLKELYKAIEDEARKRKKGQCAVISDSEAVDIIAKKLGVKNVNIATTKDDTVNLEDFF